MSYWSKLVIIQGVIHKHKKKGLYIQYHFYSRNFFSKIYFTIALKIKILLNKNKKKIKLS